MVEITEAASEADQRDMTLSEAGNDSSLLGSHGGRFSDGIVGDHLERTWAADILRAIRRKRKKSILTWTEPNRHLLVYPNFPALMMLDEQEAVDVLQDVVARRAKSLRRTVNGCQVHIFAEHSILFDVVAGKFTTPVESRLSS